VDDEPSPVDLLVEAPVGDAQQTQLAEADRAAPMPGDADHSLPKLGADRSDAAFEPLGIRLEDGRREGEKGKARHRAAHT
jgi:hypothetical protein